MAVAVDAAGVARAAGSVRVRRDAIVASEGIAGFQRRAVRALSAVASALSTLADIEDQAYVCGDASPHTTALSLAATLESWNVPDLTALLRSEQVDDLQDGPALAAHFIAGNTPLLAWTSLARALLVGAASVARMPTSSSLPDQWAAVLLRLLAEADPDLAETIAMLTWPSSDAAATRILCESAGIVLCYGADATVDVIRNQTPATTQFLGYGHRFSIAVILADADMAQALSGAALDIVTFDQQGCLSPQCVFIEADVMDLPTVSRSLAEHLDQLNAHVPDRSPESAAGIREATALARLEPRVTILQDPLLRWTVVASPSPEIDFGDAPGFVFVKPLDWVKVRDSISLGELNSKLQGTSVATQDQSRFGQAEQQLSGLGANYICGPGYLQRPPFAWREDGYPALASLIAKNSCG
jgi:hypothetical protein